MLTYLKDTGLMQIIHVDNLNRSTSLQSTHLSRESAFYGYSKYNDLSMGSKELLKCVLCMSGRRN